MTLGGCNLSKIISMHKWKRRTRSRGRSRSAQAMVSRIRRILGVRRAGMLAIVAVAIIAGLLNDAAEIQGSWSSDEQNILSLAYVSDGDTVAAHGAGGDILRIRLAGIDAPETAQPWGLEAKEYLMRLLPKGSRFQIEPAGTDRYGRVIARITLAGEDINAQMIRSGNAWVYRAYNRSESDIALESAAKKEKRGLWSAPTATPPWEWRKATRATVN